MTEREGFVELLRRHPAMLVDDGAPRPHQHSAEARKRHLGERHKQFNQPRPYGRCCIRGLGDR